MPNDRSPTLLTVRVKSPHGEPVRGARVELRRANVARAEEEGDTYVVGLSGEGDFQLFVEAGSGRGLGTSAFDHRTFRTTLFFRPPGVREAPDLRVLAAPPGQISRVDGVRAVPGGFELDVVLDYQWFTPVGYPPTLGNRVRIRIDGEEAWGAVADAIEAAAERVHLTTWIYQETTELRRPDPLAEPEARFPYTVHQMLEDTAARGVTVRLLLWDAPFIDIPRAARQAAADPGDRFEVLQEANITEGRLLDPAQHPVLSALLGAHPLYSFHQKSAVVDGKVAWVGGMNLKENDWDRPGHSHFEPGRARFSRASAFRRLVAERDHLPDHAPRHDFMAELAGPAVAHVEANFQQRWNHVRAEHGKAWENSTPAPDPAPVGIQGGSAVQVVRTMPEPYAERGILDVYLRAIGTARRYVYIEDQYFRSTHVSDALADAVRAWPELQVIVVTLQSYANSAINSGWSWECFHRIQARRPELELYTLVVADADRKGNTLRREVDLHAKILLVDDIFLSVGSCNVNDRGFELEGELNVAVVDPALVRDTRLRLFREHLRDDPRLGRSIEEDVRIWKEHAETNRNGTVPGGSTVVPFVPTARTSAWDRNAW